MDPGSGMEINPDPGYTSCTIFPRAWKQFLGLKIFKVLCQFSVADPGFIMENEDPGSGIPPGSTTLVRML
jgi:hypothetical protein